MTKKMGYVGLTGLLWALLTVLSVAAEEVDLAEVTIISAPEVKDLLEHHPDALLINNLSRIEFQQQHIPGSINIPAPEVATTSLLRTDDPRIKIFYCMGVKCAYSRHAVKLALKRGLKNIYWFQGGIPEWRQFDYPMEVDPAYAAIEVKKLSCEQIRPLLTDQSLQILDIRPIWLKGVQYFLPGTVHIQMTDLDLKLHALRRDRPILVSDVTMRQSVMAARFLIRQGFTVEGVVRGGMQRGRQKGCPVETKPAKSLSGWRAEAP